MPFITIITTKTLTLQQEVTLKEIAGKLISIFPNKTEDYLMMHIEDNQVMYFKGKELDCMKIDVQLYGYVDIQYQREFCERFMKEIEKVTQISISRQYLTIHEYEHWGMEGELL